MDTGDLSSGQARYLLLRQGLLFDEDALDREVEE